MLVISLSLAAIIGSCGWSVSLLGSGNPDRLISGNGIAVIPMDGAIAGSGSAAGGIITPEEFLDKLNRAEDDSDVKAIVLRVNSPGGTVAASEEISAYVKAAKKPVVVSVGDVDASGAYMVSSQADTIIALPGSAVGSIGVITEIPNVNGLLEKLGIKFVTITAGEYKGAGSPFEALTATETALIQTSVDEVYAQFIDIVAEGRKMERSEVESLATGWAWNGSEAKKLGLVDELGTYEDALKAAAKLGGIKGDYAGGPLRRSALRHDPEHAARYREAAWQSRCGGQADGARRGRRGPQVGRWSSEQGWSMGMSNPLVIAQISDLHCGSPVPHPQSCEPRGRRAQRACARHRDRDRRPDRHGLSRRVPAGPPPAAAHRVRAPGGSHRQP